MLRGWRDYIDGSAHANKYAAAAGQHVLAAVELVGDRRTLDVRARAGMPKRLAVARIQRQEVTQSVAGESEPGIGGQHSRARAFWPKFMAPADFAGLIVDGLNHTFAPNAVIRTRPPVDAIGWLGEVDASSWDGRRR